MKENFEPQNFEEEKNPENKEQENRENLQNIIEKEESILKEIDEAFSSMEDRQDAEKLILEKYAPVLGDAVKESGDLFDAWLNSLKERLSKEE